jgi:hypothetical protein
MPCAVRRGRGQERCARTRWRRRILAFVVACARYLRLQLRCAMRTPMRSRRGWHGDRSLAPTARDRRTSSVRARGGEVPTICGPASMRQSSSSTSRARATAWRMWWQPTRQLPTPRGRLPTRSRQRPNSRRADEPTEWRASARRSERGAVPWSIWCAMGAHRGSARRAGCAQRATARERRARGTAAELSAGNHAEAAARPG